MKRVFSVLVCFVLSLPIGAETSTAMSAVIGTVAVNELAPYDNDRADDFWVTTNHVDSVACVAVAGSVVLDCGGVTSGQAALEEFNSFGPGMFIIIH